MKEEIDIYKKLRDTTSSDKTELINKISAMEIDVCIRIYKRAFLALFVFISFYNHLCSEKLYSYTGCPLHGIVHHEIE